MIVVVVDGPHPAHGRTSSGGPRRLGYDTARSGLQAVLGHIVDFLAAALYVDDGELFVTFVDWLADTLAARSVPLSSVGHAVRTYRRLLYDFPRAARTLDAGSARVASLLGSGGTRTRR